MRAVEEFRVRRHDRSDPDHRLALFLDGALPFDEHAKAALLKDHESWSRRRLLPPARLVALALFGLAKAWRFVMPRWPHAPRTLHRLIHWGLRIFATPEASYLVLRHFHVGTEILGFIADNVDGVTLTRHPLRPRGLKELEDNLFIRHDFNLYNLVIELNAQLAAQGRGIEYNPYPDYSSISDSEFAMHLPARRWHHVVDLRTAVELYTPLFALFLSDAAFRRAADSLQLDESVTVYVSRITGRPDPLPFIHNGHPLLPKSTLTAGWRLMLHGADAEALHGHLRVLKRKQLKGRDGNRATGNSSKDQDRQSIRAGLQYWPTPARSP